jgi:hypothetical protein
MIIREASIKYEKERFEEIMAEIEELVEEAFELLPEHEKERVKCYWRAHILINVRREPEYASASMCCMEDSLDTLNGDEEDKP